MFSIDFSWLNAVSLIVNSIYAIKRIVIQENELHNDYLARVDSTLIERRTLSAFLVEDFVRTSHFKTKTCLFSIEMLARISYTYML